MARFKIIFDEFLDIKGPRRPQVLKLWRKTALRSPKHFKSIQSVLLKFLIYKWSENAWKFLNKLFIIKLKKIPKNTESQVSKAPDLKTRVLEMEISEIAKNAKSSGIP